MPFRIARHVVKQGACPTIPPRVVVEHIATEKTYFPKLLNAKTNVIDDSLNTQTFQRNWKIPELMA